MYCNCIKYLCTGTLMYTQEISLYKILDGSFLGRYAVVAGLDLHKITGLNCDGTPICISGVGPAVLWSGKV